MADQPLGALVFEYEQTLKRVCTGGDLSGSDIDDVMHFLCANANLRHIFFLWRPLLPDPKDDFVLELAVESRADFVLTFNTRDFAGAGRFGVRVISPREFLAIIGEAP
jgi:predicted nucleic acid-binding protein